MTAEFDYILVGGGLQSGLISLALRARRPQARIALVERAPRLGGNHTWCFHAEDLSPGSRVWVEPLVASRWPGYDVVFTKLRRRVHGEYSAVTSDRLHEVVSSTVETHNGSALALNTKARRIDSRVVELEDDRKLEAPIVIDARGPEITPRAGSTAGFQKFVGLELELGRPHGLELPVVMDATVDQTNGFRFFYMLPFAPDRILLEDTYFHESSALDPDTLREGIFQYAAAKGYDVKRVIREEKGVLPMPWAGSLPTEGLSPLVAGYRGGWFHPGTGYSFPIATRVAEFIAERSLDALSTGGLAPLVRDHNRQARYCHLLNRFLFRWYPPPERRNIFERFYRQPAATISRFYALRLTTLDRIRLLAGRPPRGLSLRYRMRWRSLL